MANGRRQSALLVEIMIAVLFFALSATVILEVFGTAHVQTRYADSANAAMRETRNLAESLYAAENPEAMLADHGFEDGVDGWVKQFDGFSLRVTLEEQLCDAGVLRTAHMTARQGDDVLLEMPSTRYIPEEVEP